MFKLLFDFFLNALATLIQIVLSPINAVITQFLPDVSDKILQVTNTFNTVFDAITWPLGALPKSLIITLTFILIVEIGKVSIYVGTHSISKLYKLMQKLKFW